MKETKRKSKFKNIMSIVITVIITFLFLQFVAQLAITCGNSMNNTLNNNDVVLMEKLTQKFGSLKRYDVVIFDSLNKTNEPFIKRIIGLPGETIRIDQKGNIYINDLKLEEKYGKEIIKDPGIAINGIKLEENEYFVLGDNRNDSLDSRFEEVGKIHLNQIEGKVMFSIFPPKKIH